MICIWILSKEGRDKQTEHLHHVCSLFHVTFCVGIVVMGTDDDDGTKTTQLGLFNLVNMNITLLPSHNFASTTQQISKKTINTFQLTLVSVLHLLLTS